MGVKVIPLLLTGTELTGAEEETGVSLEEEEEAAFLELEVVATAKVVLAVEEE
jgi:hypothetical protein